jgi:hypothetical protein
MLFSARRQLVSPVQQRLDDGQCRSESASAAAAVRFIARLSALQAAMQAGRIHERSGRQAGSGPDHAMARRLRPQRDDAEFLPAARSQRRLADVGPAINARSERAALVRQAREQALGAAAQRGDGSTPPSARGTATSQLTRNCCTCGSPSMPSTL